MNIKKIFTDSISAFFKINFFRYGIVGIISTVIHVTVAFLFIHFVTKSLYTSNILGFSVAFLFSYIAQSRFVFGSTLSFDKAFKYFLIQFLSLLLSIQLSNLANEFNYYFKALLVAFVLPVLTFFIHKIWTFVESE